MFDQLSEDSAGWVDDPLEDLIDEFETDWDIGSRDEIQRIVAEHGLADDLSAVTELVRIDIEFRYKHGVDLRLQEYFDLFPKLEHDRNSVNDVAFEDFRSRAAHGLVAPLDRYSDLLGVSEQSWFVELRESPEFATTRIQECETEEDLRPAEDTVSELRLESAGFHVIQQIGHGKFSRVYLAQQRALSNRFVVLKVVHEALSEPANMAMLLHTNIVPIYSFHEVDSCSIICMPYAGSVTLENFLGVETESKARTGQSLIETVRGNLDTTIDSDKDTRKPTALAPLTKGSADLLPLERLNSLNTSELGTWIFARLAAALAHSHARGVLHGDLKPANVLIRNDGEPALMDFNLSHQPNQIRKHIGGTVPYMSPETLRAMLNPRRLASSSLPEGERPDERADIYALGVMLYQFVTGRHAFPLPPSSAPADLEQAIKSRERKLDWRDTDSVSPGLRAIIEHAIEVAPRDRYQTAEDLQHDLDCERKGLSLVNAKEPARSKFRKWVARHPNLMSGGSAAALLIACLIPIVAIAASLRTKNAHLSAELAFQDFELDSNRYLTSVAVDPSRASSENIVKGVEILSKHGLLSNKLDQPIFASTNKDSRRRASESLMRHAVQVARLEIERLRSLNSDQADEKIDLSQLDQLIKVVNHVTSENSSRAVAYLNSSRAGFTDKTQQRELAKQASQLQATTDSEQYLEAVRLLSIHKYTAAKEILTALADRNSIPPELRWTSLGRSQYGEEKYEQAKISYTQSIDRAPRSSQLYVMRGLCYRQLKRLDFAIADFSKAIELDPTNKVAWMNRGLAHLNAGQPEKGIDDFTRVLEIDSNMPYVLLMRARAFRSLGKLDLANADYDQAMGLDTDDHTSLLTRSVARGRHKDFSGALADLKKVNQLKPNTPKVLAQIAHFYAVHLKNYETAISYYDQAIDVNASLEGVRIDRALVFARLGRYSEALKDLDVATKEPNSGRTHYQSACVCSLMPKEHHERGLKHLALAIRAGYDAKRLRDDPDLEALRSLQGFQAIQRTFQLGNGKGSVR